MSVDMYGSTIINSIYELYLVVVIVYRNGCGRRRTWSGRSGGSRFGGPVQSWSLYGRLTVWADGVSRMTPDVTGSLRQAHQTA